MNLVEATPGFEPGNEGFADPCLTTWPRRLAFVRKNLPLIEGNRKGVGLDRAGDGIRTHDLLLGKQSFYH
jgi:hypothetical protein